MSDTPDLGFQMQRVFPDPPPPPKDTPCVPPTQYRKDDPEESLLGTFIQWVGNNKKKTSKKQKGKQEKASKSASKLDENKKDETQPRERRNKKEKSRDRKTTKEDNKRVKDKVTRDFGSHDNPPEVKLSNPAFNNVHFSRPSTPQLTDGYSDIQSYDPDGDKYRLMYLSVRIDQQIKHVTNVLKTMIANKVKIHRIGSMLKVGEALHQFKSQLKGVRQGSKRTMKMFKSMADLQEFFDAIEAVCCSVEGIPIEDPVISENLKTMTKKVIKETPIEAATRKQLEALERKKAKEASRNSQSATTRENNNTNRYTNNLNSERVKGNMKFIHREQADGSPSNNYRHHTDQQSFHLENAGHGNRNNSFIPRQRDSKSHNGVTTVTDVRHDPKQFTDTLGSRDTNVTDKQNDQDLQQKSNVTAQAKRALYKDAKQLQNNGVYPCSEGLDDIDFDSDEESETIKKLKKRGMSKLQLLDTCQKQKDDEYDSLMAEIDTLMADTDIKPVSTTYEELMARKTGRTEGRIRKSRAQEGSNLDGSTGRKKSVPKKNSKKSDQFMESLENLLNECEKI